MDRNQLLNQLRKQELELNSPEIQIAFEKDRNPDNKHAFNQERKKYVIARQNIENANLANIAAKLKSLEFSLTNAITDLETALQSLNNTVEVLTTIRNVTSILSRIVSIV